jgi:hypothetical protein
VRRRRPWLDPPEDVIGPVEPRQQVPALLQPQIIRWREIRHQGETSRLRRPASAMLPGQVVADIRQLALFTCGARTMLDSSGLGFHAADGKPGDRQRERNGVGSPEA